MNKLLLFFGGSFPQILEFVLPECPHLLQACPWGAGKPQGEPTGRCRAAEKLASGGRGVPFPKATPAPQLPPHLLPISGPVGGGSEPKPARPVQMFGGLVAEGGGAWIHSCLLLIIIIPFCFLSG